MNVISDSYLMESDKKTLLKELRDQLEFYFKDENILFDGFLLKKVKSHKRQFVNLKVFQKFKKIK